MGRFYILEINCSNNEIIKAESKTRKNKNTQENQKAYNSRNVQLFLKKVINAVNSQSTDKLQNISGNFSRIQISRIL